MSRGAESGGKGNLQDTQFLGTGLHLNRDRVHPSNVHDQRRDSVMHVMLKPDLRNLLDLAHRAYGLRVSPEAPHDVAICGLRLKEVAIGWTLRCPYQKCRRKFVQVHIYLPGTVQ